MNNGLPIDNMLAAQVLYEFNYIAYITVSPAPQNLCSLLYYSSSYISQVSHSRFIFFIFLRYKAVVRGGGGGGGGGLGGLKPPQNFGPAYYL